MIRRPRIEAILRKIESQRKQDWEAAAAELDRMSQQGVSAAEGQQALRAATRQFPARPGDWRDWPGELVRVAASRPQLAYAPLVVELFSRFQDRAKTEALWLLAQLPEREAAVAYMEILRNHGRTGGIPHLVTQQLEQKPRHPEVFFPETLEYAGDPRLAFSIYRLCLCYCQAGLLSPETLDGHTKQVLATYAALEQKVLPAQRPSGVAWMWEEEYFENRTLAALLLDLLGFFSGPETEAALRRALEFPDSRLKCFAATSLIRRGQEVPRNSLVSIAASPEMRICLYSYLRSLEKAALFPEQYYNQAAFAEADMVNWLSFPSELGRVPDEIQLTNVISADAGPPHGVLDWYLFRFRCLETEGTADAWLAGVSGPFLRKNAPTTEGGGDTFSSFVEWDTKTPEEHVGDIRHLLEQWREAHARGEMG